MSRSELYVTALRHYLQERCGQGITERLDEVYGAEPSELDPDIARLQVRTLPRDEWLFGVARSGGLSCRSLRRPSLVAGGPWWSSSLTTSTGVASAPWLR
jgi:hypothetical protein